MAKLITNEERIYFAASALIEHAKKSKEGREALVIWDQRRPTHGQKKLRHGNTNQ